MKYFWLLAVATIIGFSACKKETFDPTITVMSPTADQIVAHMDTLHIHTTIEGAENLHEWLVEVVKVADESVVFSASDHDHDEIITIHEMWVNDMDEDTDMQLRVRVQDHLGSEVSTSVDFHAHH